MTLEEAIAALRAGKKIRHKVMPENFFVYLKDNKLCANNDDCVFLAIDEDTLDDWEIIEENQL